MLTPKAVSSSGLAPGRTDHRTTRDSECRPERPYVTLNLSVDGLSPKQLAELPIFCSLLTQVGAGERDYLQMAERLEARPELQDIRRQTVEHPFGTIKQWMNQGAFLMRRLDNVRGEFSLTALVYNLRRALNIVGVEGLIAAVKA